MADLTLLNGTELRQLGTMIYRQEAETLISYEFNSELDRAHCLHVSKTCHNTFLGLLDSITQFKQDLENDNVRAPIADVIYSYVVYALNFALLTVRNHFLRENYMNKVSEHADLIKKALKEIDPTNVTNVKRLAQDAAFFRNAMLEYTRKRNSPIFLYVSKLLKETGVTFKKLVQKYQRKANYNGPFESLENSQKLKVYDEIIKASGRSNDSVNWQAKVIGHAAAAVFLFVAGSMVWDVYTSDNKFETATRHVVQSIAGIGGWTLGEIGAVAIATGLFGAIASPVFVVAAGVLGGFGGAYIMGNAAGWLIDKIFSSGDDTNTPHLSNELQMRQCCVAPTPDASVLARQILHRNKKPN